MINLGTLIFSQKQQDYLVLHYLKLIFLNIRIHIDEYRPDS